MKHIKYPSIEQFRSVIREVHQRNSYRGIDEKGEPIYAQGVKPPVIKARGTVKLHGTNAGVCSCNDEIWAMSRKNVITTIKDNAGFAFFIEKNKNWFKDTFDKIRSMHKISQNTEVTLYGEWAGEGVQKNVAISGAPKSFYIFGLKAGDVWLDATNIRCKERRIYNVFDYTTFEVEIDFERPDIAQNKIHEMVMNVEKECPIAKEEHGISGIGEGIVFSFMFKDKFFIFKAKGDLHAGKSKVKTIKQVDSARESAKHELVLKLTPNWRLAQGLEEMFGVGWSAVDLDRKKLGDYLRWVINDIHKEDMDLIIESGFEPKEINSLASTKAREYFFEMEAKV